ncbi:MAG: ABC transporter permease [Ruminiclostridium sp.]|nr:ABC transporter permease [Ruminiclostridium sp.]
MLSLIIKQMREYFRSPVNVFMGLLFPVLLVFFLGTMLQGLDISDYDIGKIKLQYSVSGADEQSGKAFAEFLDNIDMIKAEKNNDSENALKLTDSGNTDAYIELKNGEIVLHKGRNDIVNRALSSVLNSYIAVSDTYYKIASTDPSLLMDIDADTEKLFVEQEGLGVTRSMLDYYAVSMTVMMIFMSHMMMGSTAFKDEEKIFTMSRLYLSPLGRTKLFFGKLIGILPSAVISNAVIMLLSAFVFGARYCDNFIGNLLLFLLFSCCSMAATAVGMLIGIIIKIPAEGVIIPLAWSLLFFSGSFSKEIFLEGFSDKLPPYLIQQSAFRLTLYGESGDTVITMAVCLAVTVFVSLIGAVIFRRKKTV